MRPNLSITIEEENGRCHVVVFDKAADEVLDECTTSTIERALCLAGKYIWDYS